MKFKCGDAVRFLNDTGTGIVQSIDKNGNVHVLTNDGFEIPVPEKELIFSKGFSFTEQEDLPDDKPVASKIKEHIESIPEKQQKMQALPKNVSGEVSLSLILGFIPENQGPVFNNKLACYLVNDSPYFIYYKIGTKEGGNFYYLSSGLIEADTKSYILSFDQTRLSKISDIHIQAIWLNDGKYVPRPPVDKTISLNLVNFSKESYYRENDYFEEKAVLFDCMINKVSFEIENITITDEQIRAKNEEEISGAGKRKKKEPVSDTLEIDLHANELILQDKQYTPAEIMAMQLSRFHAAMEEAISKKLRRLVIIHGIGQGILKMQIRKELQEKYPKCVYQDASFKEYGFGATMVHLAFE